MGDVDVHSNFTITEKKTKKVKKTTKRRESNDHGSEVTITEIERTNGNQGYVLAFLRGECNKKIFPKKKIIINIHTLKTDTYFY